ncbi:MAG: Phenylalanine--tRNA ligase alpha subunit [Alphaproteobacteria bacterium MarineAlpha12_Bin1]|jgi:phenylalanyl-tRNA synthetase alpha chain|nr:MAG: Phenylalanine--tRNA ligase alpha subunit [Alphaproteobacteria bacterium MarineAlpha12_Bin1]|tara:strand:- start:5598 stop:6686 length:1089 start_codon:yes stop_codon:yes gene_type:complete
MTPSDLKELESTLLNKVKSSDSLRSLDSIRVSILGRKGEITEHMKSLSALGDDERKKAGQNLNSLKSSLIEAISVRQIELEAEELEGRLLKEKSDVTLPIRPKTKGSIHPVSQAMEECVAIFGQMGFSVAEGPDIEDDFHNFTALNIPPEHPARQMHDTFYLPEGDEGDKLVLRTHTSPVQIRTMENSSPPIRIIAPGRTYRSDSDSTHTPMFHQIEALVIDEETHMGHLKGCIIDFCRAFFGIPDLPVRFRPSHFPFTEPSMEVDIGCSRENDELKIGNFGDGADNWLEIMGSGMVHPKVLEFGGINPQVYQGFAFGLGIDRIAMLKYGIPDLRTFFDADLRWLSHYGFDPLSIPSMIRGL